MEEKVNSERIATPTEERSRSQDHTLPDFDLDNASRVADSASYMHKHIHTIRCIAK